jgi:hypothetical protein
MEGSDEPGKHYLVGRVYPREHCYGNGPDAESTKDITDNLPQDVMERLNLKGIPLTSGHPPVNKVIRDAPDIVRGRVSKSFVNHDGDLWAVSELDTSTDRGQRLLENVKNGKEMGLSLGHVFNAKTVLGKITSSEHVPDHLGIVDTPRRPNCFVYHFVAKNDIPSNFTSDHVANLTKAISRLPATKRTIVNAHSSCGDKIEVTSHPTCSLGTVVDPGTLSFEPSTQKPTGGGDMIRTTVRHWASNDDTLAGYNEPLPFQKNLQKKENIPYSQARTVPLQGKHDINRPSTESILHSRVVKSPSRNKMASQTGAQINAAPGAAAAPGTVAPSAVQPQQQQQQQSQRPHSQTSSGNGVADGGVKGDKYMGQGKNDNSQSPGATIDESTKSASGSNGPPSVVRAESIKEEFEGMDDDKKLDAMAVAMNVAKKAQYEVEMYKQKLNELESRKNQAEQEESTQITNKISSFLDEISRAAQEVEKSEGQSSESSGTLDNRKMFETLMSRQGSIEDKRMLSQLVESSMQAIQVASKKSGDMQNQANKRRRVMSTNSGNDSIFAFTRSHEQQQQGQNNSINDFLRFDQDMSGGGGGGSQGGGGGNEYQERPANLANMFKNHGVRHEDTYESSSFDSSGGWGRSSRPITDEYSENQFANVKKEMDAMNSQSNQGYSQQRSRVTFRNIDPMQ